MAGDGKSMQSWGGKLIVLGPYLWLVALFLIPFLVILKISVSQTAIALPPYTPVLDLKAGWNGISDFLSALSLDNYLTLASDRLYLWSYARSLEIAAVSTVVLLLIGYPIGYAMARAPGRLQAILVMLVVLPFWTSFLIRVYAWINILQRDGLLNQLLVWSGLIREPAAWLSSDTAIYIGMIYSYLPFMVLPLYATLQKIDDGLLEAAADLGCARWKAFWAITVPLSMPGAGAGALLCFIPISGEFVIPDLLGGSDKMMIGQTLWVEFFANKDWPVASAIAIVLLFLLVVPIAVYENLQAHELEGGG